MPPHIHSAVHMPVRLPCAVYGVLVTQLLSMVASEALSFGVRLYVFAATGSIGAVAALATVSALPQIPLVLLAGRATDAVHPAV